MRTLIYLVMLHKTLSMIYVLIYIDDIIIINSSSPSVNALISTLGRWFSFKDLRLKV